jgi:hypothetical protein
VSINLTASFKARPISAETSSGLLPRGHSLEKYFGDQLMTATLRSGCGKKLVNALPYARED